jgi:hypothetical protein
MFRIRTASADDWIEWIGTYPEGEAEEVAYEAIVLRNLHRYANVARCIGDLLVARDLRRYGPNMEAGFFRRWYVGEAYRVLSQLEGTRVRTVPRSTDD